MISLLLSIIASKKVIVFISGAIATFVGRYIAGVPQDLFYDLVQAVMVISMSQAAGQGMADAGSGGDTSGSAAMKRLLANGHATWANILFVFLQIFKSKKVLYSLSGIIAVLLAARFDLPSDEVAKHIEYLAYGIAGLNVGQGYADGKSGGVTGNRPIMELGSILGG